LNAILADGVYVARMHAEIFLIVSTLAWH
jgi:hypothetical protein